MRIQISIAISLSLLFVLVLSLHPDAQTATCSGSARVQYVCNQAGPEDLAVIRASRTPSV